jgi:hypothetical protein
MTNVTGFRGMIRGFIAMIAAPFAPLATTQAQAELTLCNRTSFRMEAAVGIEKRECRYARLVSPRSRPVPASDGRTVRRRHGLSLCAGRP